MLIAALMVSALIPAHAFDASPAAAQKAGRFLASNSHRLLDGYFDDYPTTRFREVYVHLSEGGEFWALCGEANTKNDRGGYSGWDPFAILMVGEDQIAVANGINGIMDSREYLTLCAPRAFDKPDNTYRSHDFAGELVYRGHAAGSRR